MNLNRRHLLAFVILIITAAGYWLLPISGDVYVVLHSQTEAERWPRLRLEPDAPQPGQPAVAVLADTVPWVYVALFVNGEEAEFLRYEQTPLGYGEWRWSFTVPHTPDYELAFYHDCDQGCVAWTRQVVNNTVNTYRTPATFVPTKLGVVFANPQRNWHNRSGWMVELTYAQRVQETYWGIDDLAARVEAAVSGGHRVLVRVDYEQGQSLPPPGDSQALETYLAYLRRLARDDRLRGVYGYVIGSSFNALASNRLAADNPVTAEWYARIFNGYGTDAADVDNAVAIIRAENPTARVLVGPVQPWLPEAEGQTGEQPFRIDAPWLNYFNTLVATLGQSAQERAEAGFPLAGPDGFAVQAFGRPGSSQLDPGQRSQEPLLDLRRPQWDGAQAGFRVYRDWLAVINAHDHSRGLPVYITAGNTFDAAGNVPPAQNYVSGWLTAALAAVNQESQVKALCWFVDYLPIDDQWAAFSLTHPQGKVEEAAAEFEALLLGKAK